MRFTVVYEKTISIDVTEILEVIDPTPLFLNEPINLKYYHVKCRIFIWYSGVLN